MTALWTSIFRFFRRRPKAPAVSPQTIGRGVRETPQRHDKATPARRDRRVNRRRLGSTFSGRGPLGTVASVRQSLVAGDPFSGLSAESERDALLREIVARLTEIRGTLKAEGDVHAVRTLAESVATKRLDMPRLPDVAQQLMLVDINSDFSFADLAQKIAQDQDLTARVLEVANSPIYTRTELDSLERAVGQLGLPTFKNVVLGAVADAAIYRVPGFQQEVRRERRKAMRTSRIAAGFAVKKYGNSQAGVASLAGLLHDAGRVLVLRNLGAAMRLPGGGRVRVTKDVAQQLMARLHMPLGLYYARLHKLPRSVRVAMAHDSSLTGVHPTDMPIAMSVAVAQAVCESTLPDGS